MPYQIKTQSFTALKGKERLDHFKNTSKQDASEILRGVRANLIDKKGRVKEGSVRLLHTSHAEKNMKIGRVGTFKAMFIKNAKHRRSADCMIDLLNRAGLPKHRLDALKAALKAGGSNQLYTRVVVAAINEILPQSAPTADEALLKFGVEPFAEKKNKLGSGGFGTVNQVIYNSTACAFKKFKIDQDVEKHRVPIASASNPNGDVIEPRSRESFDSDDQPPQFDKEKIKKIEELEKKWQQQRIKDAAGSMSSDSSVHADHEVDENQSGFRYGEAEPDASQEAPPLGNAQLINPEPAPAGPNPAQRRDSIDSAAAAVVEPARLGRKAIVNVTRVKDIPQVVKPLMLLVREERIDAPPQYHAVPGGAAFKAWARLQKSGANLLVEGALMPKAKGKPLGEDRRDGFKVNCKPADLKPMARSGLTGLQGLAAHGFIHGDIKPNNLFFDNESKTLQFIDVDGLQKVSKKDGSKMEGSESTRRYAHPLMLAGKPCGVGKDLCAFGVTVLESALYAKNQSAVCEDILRNMKISEEPFAAGQMAKLSTTRMRMVQNLKDEQKRFPADSEEHFGLQCIITSIEYEESRINSGQENVFERYTATNANHPLNQLSQHPAIAGGK